MHRASQALTKRTAAPAAVGAAGAAYPAVPAIAAVPASARPNRQVFGFAQAGGLSSSSSGWKTWDFSLLTTVAYFGIHVNSGDGHLVQGDSGWTTWQGSDVTNMIAAAHNAGAQVVLTIVSQESSSNECVALQHASTTIGEAVTQMNARGVDGINVDYESGNAACGGTDNRTLLRQMVQSLRAQMPSGKQLTVDTYGGSAGDSTGQNFFDVRGMAGSVNAFFVMAYDLDGTTSGGGNWQSPPLSCTHYCFSPSSPYGAYAYNDQRIAQEYVNVVGAAKTILGLPYYGYAACVDSPTENAYASSNPQWTVPRIVDVQDLQSSVSNYTQHTDSHDGVDHWETYQSPSYGNCWRELYIDDAYTIGRKYDLVNQYGLAGTGMWSLDYGGGVVGLWNDIASHFTLAPTAPASVSACAGANSVYVSWPAATSAAGGVTQYTVTATPNTGPAPAPMTVSGGVTGVQFGGLTPGTTYTFTVQAQNGNGSGPVSPISNAVSPASSATYSYFTWYDRASPGMNADNIHMVAPAGASGCVYVSGVAAQSFAVDASGTYVNFPGRIGGPVVIAVTSGGPVLAAQRVQYNQSFNEIRANADAATALYLPWYDHASPGMWNDNIHVTNPGGGVASVKITGPGPEIDLQIQPGSEGIGSWPQGTIGGPVKISSDQPVLASQRVQYYDTFNETPAKTVAQDAGSSIVFNWYDRASPGMWNDNVHLVNPNGSPVTATLSVAGQQKQVTVPAGGTAYAGFPNTIGGPLTVTVSGPNPLPVIASQRVQYYNSFNEVAGVPVSSPAVTTSQWLLWYDAASTGMVADNVHIVNPNPLNTAHVTVTGPIGTKTVDVAPGGEQYLNFPHAIGGPLHVTSTGAAVIAAQRVQYYQTFNEAGALAG